MPETTFATLSNIRTVQDMIIAFRDEDHCRCLSESMIWPNGRVCPARGYKRSIAIACRNVAEVVLTRRFEQRRFEARLSRLT